MTRKKMWLGLDPPGTTGKLKKLGKALLHFKSLADVDHWLEQNAAAGG